MISRELKEVSVFLLLIWWASPVGFLKAADKVDRDIIGSVDSLAQEQDVENEAELLAIQQKGYKKLRAAERRARVEALKLELEKRKRKRFAQRLRYETSYDSNYFDERHPSEKGSIVYNVTSLTDLDLSGERVKLRASYSPTVEVPARFHQKGNEVTRVMQRFGTRLEVPIGKKTFVRGRYGLFRGNDRATSETTNFTLRTENNVGGEMEYFLNKNFSTAFEYAFYNRHFTAEAQRENSSQDQWFLPRFSYYLTPKTSLFFQTGIGKSTGGSRRSYYATNLRLTVGVRGNLTRKSSAYINVGVIRKNMSEHPAFVKNYTGLFLENVYLYRPGPKTVIQIIAGSSTENSYAGSSYFLPKNITLSITRQLLKRLSSFWQIGARRNEYPRRFYPAEGIVTKKDYFYNTQIGVRYELWRNLSIGLRYAFDYRNSSFNSDGYRKNHVYLVEVELSV
ncbi:MAG TPA: outer membrane beta-barrel protein [Candidatus Omnitrophota bacterium]|nr:outer membrane beta-barrel protein [Candidatus Omnitrophota bacterium]